MQNVSSAAVRIGTLRVNKFHKCVRFCLSYDCLNQEFRLFKKQHKKQQHFNGKCVVVTDLAMTFYLCKFSQSCKFYQKHSLRCWTGWPLCVKMHFIPPANFVAGLLFSRWPCIRP